MGVFRFPENGTIPLHDHPGMTVVSKLLYGRVRVLSYDWAEAVPSPSTTRGPRRARLVADRIIQAPIQPLSLYPDDANVHMFHALTPAALLDVLAPPYAVGEGRDCHYFAKVPLGPNGEACGENEAWLLETECPESFEVNRGTYLGPKVGSEAEAG
jgi:cysteamine dioxygenase